MGVASAPPSRPATSGELHACLYGREVGLAFSGCETGDGVPPAPSNTEGPAPGAR